MVGINLLYAKRRDQSGIARTGFTTVSDEEIRQKLGRLCPVMARRLMI